ncbi:hypothetical protein EOL73_02355 [Candidatus Saccharibacteria bacterium]|nr:hypothetical protein [Candidatus Saccharibacteria bacterium]
MKRKNLVLAVGLVLVMCAQSFTAFVGAISTTETDFTPVTKLIISAYGWEYAPAIKDVSGKIIDPEQRWLTYVQIFNSGDVPLDLSDYSLRIESLDSEGVTDCSLPDDCMSIDLPKASESGYLPSGKHFLLASDGAVEGYQHEMQEFLLPTYQKSTVPWFRIVIGSDSERETDVVAKLDSRTDFDNEYADWLRNENSTGTGYYEGFTAVSVAPRVLFDDVLYFLPFNPLIRIDEIYPYSQQCLPDSDSLLCYDYIKIHVDNSVDLKNYVLRTSSSSSSRTSDNTFWLGLYTPNENGYITIYQNDDGEPYSLTNDGGRVWIEDLYGLVSYDDTVMRYESATASERGWSWMLQDNLLWGWSTTPSPNVANLFTYYEPEENKVTVCPEGKYLNPDTNRCRTIEEAVNALAACPEGQERNPLTNRCRKIEQVATTSLAPCGEGQERNPLTNRCRSIASAVAELLPCDEGYERNPATNRCRKVLGAATNTVSNYDKLGTSESNVKQAESPWGWLTVGTVGLCALGYAGYEWRSELKNGTRKLVQRFKKV